ncbi:MAG TPA: hypothetical protein VKA30_04065 [Actinomycetota bacterium]|nr:hypothetical protein [Actinomycetota bacterium]
MPRRKTCSRCRAPINPDMAWCARCLAPTPWASAVVAKRHVPVKEWPDIWSADTAAAIHEPAAVGTMDRAVPRAGFHPLRRLHENRAMRTWRRLPISG